MKTDGSNANSQLAVAEKKEPKTMGEWLSLLKKEVEPSIPSGTVGIDRFMESVKIALFDPKVPDLLKCSHASQKRAIVQAANYGLEVGGVLGQSYFIPYNENVKLPNGQFTKEMTCHFQIGYKGLITLARRSNTIKTIAAECIYENDIFECELASGRSIHHKIDIKRDRGEVIGYYCLVELANGGEQFAIMSKSDAEKFRDKYSKSYLLAKQSGKGLSENNWTKNFDAMALKTCVIKALKLCPISIEALRAVQTEEQSDYNDTNVNAKDVTIAAPSSAEVAEDVEYEVHDEEPETKKRGRPSKKEVLENMDGLSKGMPTEETTENVDESGIEAAFDALPKNSETPNEIY